MAEAFPLQWPAGWPRTAPADRKPYPAGASQTWNAVIARLQRELRLLGAEHLRGLERHGGGQMMQRAFHGFRALPAPAAADAWHAVLGIDPSAPPAEVEAAYRRRIKLAHPDHGGSTDEFQRVRAAYEQARKVRA